MTDTLSAVISAGGAIIAAIIGAAVALRKSGSQPKATDVALTQSEADQADQTHTEAEPPASDDTHSKIDLIQAAISQGRPICHCTESGEIMLLVRRGLSSRHLYQCPKCKRRQEVDVPPHIY